jgi:gluconolactonase
MKTAWLGLATLTLVWACGGEDGPTQPGNAAGTGNSGVAGSTAGSGSGGSSTAGTGGSNSAGAGTSGAGTGGSSSTAGSGGSAAGAAGAGGSGGAAGGSGGAAGGSGGAAGGSGGAGGAPQGVCPAGPFGTPMFGTPERVAGLPPADSFNNMNNDFTNIEGAVWVGDAIYVSEISSQGSPPPSRILKVASDGTVSIAVPTSGTNGLAVNGAGELFGAKHADGSISKIALPGGAATVVAGMFMGKRFNSPNDLAIHSNGTIYFTDPNYQAPMPAPQMQTSPYIVKAGGMPEAITGQFSQPNGITLSKAQDVLYIADNSRIRKFPVMADGSLGAAADFVNGGSDGMVIDCADNLYITNNGVKIYDKAGQQVGTTLSIGGGQVTNVAFGGADRKTLYVTAMGSGMQKGLYKVPMNVPGYPY